MDLSSALFDPTLAAVAVRALLDEAEAQLRASGSMSLSLALPTLQAPRSAEA